jgi:hypothetical protein
METHHKSTEKLRFFLDASKDIFQKNIQISENSASFSFNFHGGCLLTVASSVALARSILKERDFSQGKEGILKEIRRAFQELGRKSGANSVFFFYSR